MERGSGLSDSKGHPKVSIQTRLDRGAAPLPRSADFEFSVLDIKRSPLARL